MHSPSQGDRHGTLVGMSANPSVSLSVMADHVERYQEEVGDFVPGYQLTEHDDVAGALVEAERALRTAARLLRRAAKLAAAVH
jgi:hypothetical protein